MNNIPTYPPHEKWDSRMVSPNVCSDLLPVKSVHQNSWFTVKDRGGYFTTEMDEAQGVVLPVVDNKAVVLVRVRRPVIGDETIELPAGGFTLMNESPEQGVSRELAEETGIMIKDISRMIPLPPISISPNRNPRLMFIFKINLSQGEFDSRGVHDDEVTEVLCVSFKKVLRMIKSGEIYVALPIAVLLRYLITE